MKNFSDFATLRSALQEVYAMFPAQPEQRLTSFAGVLEQQLDFTKDDDALFAWIVLTRNAEGSADWIGSSAIH